MFFLKSKISILGVIVVLGTFVPAKVALAMQQQTSGSDATIKNMRGNTSQPIGQDQRSNDKEEVEFTKGITQRETEHVNASRRREAIRAALITRRLDRMAERENRLSPEERLALRRQIREARIGIYLRNNQKKAQSPD
ncbi:hypothetical protein [Undibacterium sp.]|uniref:hypothetical protein n=1 Tax=Undibacterium sp. TaxID=1914977 RepID=UPI00374FF601